MEKHNQKNIDAKSKTLLIWGMVSFTTSSILIIFLPVIVTKWSIVSLNTDKPNEIGDTIGGIMGPTVALLGAGLTFLAFWAQYAANKEQRRQFEKSISEQAADSKKQEARFISSQRLQKEQIDIQDKRTRKEQFENKYYNLLNIHRQNAREVHIPQTKLKGAKAFFPMIQELKVVYDSLYYHYFAFAEISTNNDVTKEECFQLSYLIFFFGMEINDRNIWEELLTPKLEKILETLYNDLYGHLPPTNRYFTKAKSEFYEEYEYHPFKGHSEHLSHYIRHLFQTVKFVDEQPVDLLTDIEKYNYLTNLRAQLTTNEQLFLYYNSLSIMGFPWRGRSDSNKEDYFEKYCLIKSLPLPLANFYLKPLKDKVLPQFNRWGKPMFEWTEIKERLGK